MADVHVLVLDSEVILILVRNYEIFMHSVSNVTLFVVMIALL